MSTGLTQSNPMAIRLEVRMGLVLLQHQTEVNLLWLAELVPLPDMLWEEKQQGVLRVAMCYNAQCVQAL